MSEPTPTDTTTTPPGETATPAAVTPAPVAAPAVTSSKTFTQEEVNAIVTARLAQQQRSMQKPVENVEPKKVSNEELLARLEMSEKRRDFEKRAARRGLDDEATNDLFDLMTVQKPADLDTWLDGKAKAFVKPTPAPPAAPAAPAATTPAATTPPAAAPNAPVKNDLLTNSGLVDIFNLTPAQLDQLGPQGLREHFEKAVAVGNRLSGAPARPKLPART